MFELVEPAGNRIQRPTPVRVPEILTKPFPEILTTCR
jgi:hypothetical protein